MNEALRVIHRRRSVRNFTGQKVKKADMMSLLKAAMAAPTAVNMQPWEFIAVTERQMLDRLADGLPYAKMLYRAGAAIVVCAVPEKAHGKIREYAVIDASLASENILLAAEALGLGAVWTALYPDREREEYARKLLRIPKDVIPLNVIPVGYPTGEDKKKNKFRDENIHWEEW